MKWLPITNSSPGDACPRCDRGELYVHSSPTDVPLEAGHRQCVEWYHDGQSRIVEVNGVRIEVRFVGRKGRRARIAINAPAGAGFQAVEPT